MAKVTAAQIEGMGFAAGMYGGDQAAFETMIAGLIAELSVILEGRLGAAAYADTGQPAATYVLRAEKCLVAAEMIQARIVYITGNAVPNGEEPKTASLDRQREKYLAEAEGWIARIVAGTSVDSAGFAFGVTVSSGADRATLKDSREPAWRIGEDF